MQLLFFSPHLHHTRKSISQPSQDQEAIMPQPAQPVHSSSDLLQALLSALRTSTVVAISILATLAFMNIIWFLSVKIDRSFWRLGYAILHPTSRETCHQPYTTISPDDTEGREDHLWVGWGGLDDHMYVLRT